MMSPKIFRKNAQKFLVIFIKKKKKVNFIFKTIQTITVKVKVIIFPKVKKFVNQIKFLCPFLYFANQD